jgi:hypothetical protein
MGNVRFHPCAKAQGFPAPDCYKKVVKDSAADKRLNQGGRFSCALAKVVSCLD